MDRKTNESVPDEPIPQMSISWLEIYLLIIIVKKVCIPAMLNLYCGFVAYLLRSSLQPPELCPGTQAPWKLYILPKTLSTLKWRLKITNTCSTYLKLGPSWGGGFLGLYMFLFSFSIFSVPFRTTVKAFHNLHTALRY